MCPFFNGFKVIFSLLVIKFLSVNVYLRYVYNSTIISMVWKPLSNIATNLSGLKLSPFQWRQQRKGLAGVLRSAAAVPRALRRRQRPRTLWASEYGSRSLLTRRWLGATVAPRLSAELATLAARLAVSGRGTTVDRRQLPVDRRPNSTSRRRAQPNSHVVKWNCQTWSLSHTGVVSVKHYSTFITICLWLRSGVIILENWIIRTNNGLSQVSYFGCWSQRGTSLFYHVHRRTFRRLGYLI